jgi:hypothetical protein
VSLRVRELARRLVGDEHPEGSASDGGRNRPSGSTPN